MKFASAEWCAAYKAVTEKDPQVQKGIVEPDKFNYKMELGTEDQKFHAEFKKGRPIFMGEPKFDEKELDFVIIGDLDAWQRAAAGEAATQLLSMGKFAFKKGSISTAIRNAGAFNALMRGIGKVPTEW